MKPSASRTFRYPSGTVLADADGEDGRVGGALDGSPLPDEIDETEDLLVEEISIDGMCGVY